MNRPPLAETLVSVVLPVYNEGHVLRELHNRVQRVLMAAGVRQEIIFVNDGSTDSSSCVLDKLAQRNAEVRVLHLSRNFGHQAALHAGLAEARGDAVIVMDSDLQDEPEAIARFLAAWQRGVDVVYAIRSERQEAWWKRLLFASFHRLLAKIAASPIAVDAGNFSLIDARLARQIVALGERDRYLPGLRSWVGFSQQGIPVRRNPRYDDRPRVSLRGLWRLAKTAIFSFSSAPLSVFHAIGLLSSVAFALLSGWSLAAKLFTHWAVPGWASQVLVASFFGAINALGISMLGEYVTRIYDQVRGRPLYIVARRASQADSARELAPACDLTEESSLAAAANELVALTAARLENAAAMNFVERRAASSIERGGETGGE